MKLKLFNLLLLITLMTAQEHAELVENDEDTTTENSVEVQCEKSLFSKEDLLLIIDDVLNTLSFHKNINDTIQTKAVPMRDKYIKRIKTSMEWFAERPEHLRHILEDVSLNRQFIEKNVAKIRKSFEKHTDLATLFEEKSDRAKKILKNFVRNKKLCELNCGHNEVDFRNAVREDTPDRYCASFTDLQNVIHKELEKIGIGYPEQILKQIKAADENYDEKINAKFEDLKEIALKEFGRTMYDVLDLHDRYQHLIIDLKDINAEKMLLELTDLNVEIDNLLVKLNNVVNIYSRYCKTCDGDTIKYYGLFQDRQYIQKEDLLDSLIKSKLTEIYNSTQSDLQNIFQELDEKLSEVNLDNELLSKLKPLEKEINEVTKKEIDAFNAIDVPGLKIDIDLIKKLFANTIDLIRAIVREYDAIQKVIEDFVPTEFNEFRSIIIS